MPLCGYPWSTVNGLTRKSIPVWLSLIIRCLHTHFLWNVIGFYFWTLKWPIIKHDPLSTACSAITCEVIICFSQFPLQVHHSPLPHLFPVKTLSVPSAAGLPAFGHTADLTCNIGGLDHNSLNNNYAEAPSTQHSGFFLTTYLLCIYFLGKTLKISTTTNKASAFWHRSFLINSLLTYRESWLWTHSFTVSWKRGTKYNSR